jgi:peptide/nickel transport system substrate-binding protein
VAASGTKGARVTLVAGPFGTTIPLLAASRYVVSVLDHIGYRASLRVISNDTTYNNTVFDSRRHTQMSWFSWYTDYPAPSDMVDPLLSCRSFVPAGPAANLNSAEFCDPHVDALVRQALHARAPSRSAGLWTQIDRILVDQAPWVPIYNPRVLVVVSPRVGNYQFDSNAAVMVDQL